MTAALGISGRGFEYVWDGRAELMCSGTPHTQPSVCRLINRVTLLRKSQLLAYGFCVFNYLRLYFVCIIVAVAYSQFFFCSELKLPSKFALLCTHADGSVSSYFSLVQGQQVQHRQYEKGGCYRYLCSASGE